ncbi:MAG: protein kinase [Propionibacteriaceae bacterium]|jgi:serine/threonine protein kinase|nr:protein kinase [Propionibacteriaceae bacterium]
MDDENAVVGDPSKADAHDFLVSYQGALDAELSDWPATWTQAYQVDECLKAEESKRVFLVTDRRTGGRAIVRSTAGDAAGDAGAEAEILAGLNHPGIPKVYGSFTGAGRSFIVREYLAGESLDQVVARGPLAAGQALGMLRQLCGILGYLQTRRPPVVHRDLKPQNIIVRPDGTLGLTDFGIARTLKPGQTSDTSFAGTRDYAPPEQYGYGQSTPASDIFALGVVVIFMLTGSPDRAGLAAIGDRRLREVVAKCVEYDPAKRFHSAAEVLKALDGGNRTGWFAGAALALAAIGAGCLLLPSLLNPSGPNGLLPSPAAISQSSPAPVTPSPAPTSPPASPAATPAASPTATRTPETTIVAEPSSEEIAALFRKSSGDLLATHGNYPRNIQMGGFAVGGKGVIYVSDGNGLYEIGANGKFKRRLSEDAGIKSLNYYQGKLYYVFKSDIYTMDPATAEATLVKAAGLEYLYVEDGRFFGVTTFGSFWMMDMDGSDSQYVNRSTGGGCYAGVVDGIAFGSGCYGYRLYVFDLDTGVTANPGFYDMHWPFLWDGYLYFESHSDGNAYRWNGGLEPERLPNRNYFTYIVPTERGFFAPASSGIYLVDPMGGSENKQLCDQPAYRLNVAGDWLVFIDKQVKEGPSYQMVRTDGTGLQKVPTK